MNTKGRATQQGGLLWSGCLAILPHLNPGIWTLFNGSIIEVKVYDMVKDQSIEFRGGKGIFSG